MEAASSQGSVRKKGAVVLRVIGLYIAIISVVYLLMGCVVFNFAHPARIFDEETRAGHEVVAGPTPWAWAAKPTYHGMFYTGKEWPFVAWAPICWGYRIIKGYAPPS